MAARLPPFPALPFVEMAHEVIRTFDSLDELGEFIDAGAPG
jgi:hypothetical protein